MAETPTDDTLGFGQPSGTKVSEGGFGYEKIPTVSTEGEYGVLPQGAEYMDPQGNHKRKPYVVTDDHSYAKVPEGAHYIDPKKVLRQKPKYEGVNFTSQTLYDMSITDKERRKALEFSYPGKVKGGDGQDLYVDDDGVLRKPGRSQFDVDRVIKFGALGPMGIGAAIATDAKIGPAVASMAAPTGGAVLGTIGGAAAAAPTGPGAIAGGMAGGFGGGVLGQSFNDLVLRLAGVYDRSIPEEAGNLALAGMSGAAGAGVGRGISTVVGAAKPGIAAGGAALPKLVAGVLGADAERLATAKRLADEGVRVPPSSVFPEAPYLHTAVETFDPKFRTQNVLREGAERFYEEKAGGLLDSIDETVRKAGAEPTARAGKLTNPEAAVSSERAGAALLAKTGEEMAAQDAKLAAAIARLKQEVQAGQGAKSASYNAAVNDLRAAAEASQKAAQEAVDAGFKSIQSDIDAAFKVAEVGGNSGELWTKVAGKLQAAREGVQARARIMYNAADEAAGGLRPNTEGLPQIAREFEAGLPDNFRAKYPDIVKKLKAWAGEVDEEGKVVVEPIVPTFGELRNLRSQFRSHVDYYDLTPTQQEGTYKYFAKRVNEALHDPNAPPELKQAASLLDQADKFYADNMKAFRDKTIQGVVRSIEAGLPADPQMLANTILKEGRSELINDVKNKVGPNLWAAVKAADMQEMLNASKTLIPGQIDGKVFAKQILDRIQSGKLAAVYDPATAAKLEQQAQYIAMLDGKVPTAARPGDTIASVIERARADADALKQAGKADPLGTLEKEMRNIDNLGKRQASQMRKTRADDQLGFLYDRTTGASEAADRILKDPDLIFAAAQRFGENSAEFQLLRQVFAQRVLQGSMDVGAKLEKITPEIQRIMFPGATLEEMQTLAKNMDFLLGSKALRADGTGASIAAQSRVLNPWGSITGLGKFAKPLKIIPGMETAGRFILTKYYKLLSEASTSPAVMQWLAKGLEGTPVQRETVRQAVQRAQSTGQPLGAAIAETLYASPRGESSPPPRRSLPARSMIDRSRGALGAAVTEATRD